MWEYMQATQELRFCQNDKLINSSAEGHILMFTAWMYACSFWKFTHKILWYAHENSWVFVYNEQGIQTLFLQF